MTSVSAEQEKRREDEDYGHRHIDIVTKPKVRRFYVPQCDEQTFIELEKILQREHKSFSKWIRAYAVDYVRLHTLGNPQQRIDVVLKTGRPYRAVNHCKCGCVATRFVTLEDTSQVYCCSSHMPRLDIIKFFQILTKNQT